MTAADPQYAAGAQTLEAHARELDAADPLRRFRERFIIPKTKTGEDVVYLAGNSLGLQPRHVATLLNEELEDWATLAVEAHFRGRRPWYSYHEMFRESGAALVGGTSGGREVVMMNSLTVNLHLMLVSFYQPTKTRFKVLLDWPQFPSDLYALETHIKSRGFDPREAMVFIKPPDGKHTITP